jgi:hypothetical protein
VITASNLLGYDATSLAHLYLGSFFHSSLQILSCTAIFRSVQRCSIRWFMRRLWLGHSRTFRNLSELCQGDHPVLGHLPDQSPSPPIAQLGRAANSRKSLGGSKLLPFKNVGCHCVLGDLQCYIMFWGGTLPQIGPQHNPVSELYGHFLRPHGLVSALTCTVN